MAVWTSGGGTHGPAKADRGQFMAAAAVARARRLRVGRRRVQELGDKVGTMESPCGEVDLPLADGHADREKMNKAAIKPQICTRRTQTKTIKRRRR